MVRELAVGVVVIATLKVVGTSDVPQSGGMLLG